MLWIIKLINGQKIFLIKRMNWKTSQEFVGETTLLVPEVYHVCNWSLKFQVSVIGPSSFQNEQYKSFS